MAARSAVCSVRHWVSSPTSIRSPMPLPRLSRCGPIGWRGPKNCARCARHSARCQTIRARSTSAPRCVSSKGCWSRDALITTDAGNFAGWATRFINFRDGQRYIGPTNGAMGYSVPAAIGAKIAYPDRMVVSLVGDGGFLMTGQELATAFHHGVAPIVLVFNNQMYGTIRMHQERAYPGRVSGTAIDQSGFCQVHRGVRRAWRGGERDAGIRAGISPRGGQRQAGSDRAAHEPRADHHARHDCGIARGQGGKPAAKPKRAAAPKHPKPARGVQAGKKRGG